MIDPPSAPPSASPTGTLLSLNVGLPKNIPWNKKTVFTGVYKYPVADARMVRRLNVDGDGQGDLAGHGGEQRAVLVYQESSYEHWREHLGRDDLTPGSFGENFTVSGLADDDVFIGDRYRIGDAEFEVTQPRVTCFRVGLRLGVPEMPSLLVAHRRPGFYLRVITEGMVRAGDTIVKSREGRHRLSVAAIDGLLYLPDRSIDLLRLSVDVPALSPGWQQSFRELLDAGEAGKPGSPPPIGTEPQWDGFRPFTVTRIVRETDTVLSLFLADSSGAPLPPPRPGQYVTLRIPRPEGAAVRSYSISGLPDPSTYRISVKREEHGVISRYIHSHLSAGAAIDVAAPRGEFILDEGDEPVVLLSAGIGVTPVIAMLASLAKMAARREVWWLHAARTADDYALAGEARDLLDRLPDAHVRVFLSRASSETVDAPGVVNARLTVEQLDALGLPTESVAYICGPTGFIAAMTEALADVGLAPDRIRSELFGALPPLNPGVVPQAAVLPHLPAGAPGTGPSVTFARSGLSVNWSDAYDAILELAESCDIPTRWSCRTGVCHNCITGLISGEIHYSPQPLETPEADQVLLCCSQPVSDLILDA